MAVEDLDDDAGAVQHLGAGGALEVADLAGRELMIDDDELGLAGGAQTWLSRIGLCWVDRRGNAFKPLPRLGLRGWRHRADHTGATGQRRQLRKLAAAQQQPCPGALALLRHCADNLIAQRLHQAPQLLKAGFVRDVVDVGCLDADEDGKRDWRFGLHRQSSSTDRPEAWKSHLSV